MEVCNGSDFGCNWISYSQQKQLCLYLETCTLDVTNGDFISAHASCGAPPISKQNRIFYGNIFTYIPKSYDILNSKVIDHGWNY